MSAQAPLAVDAAKYRILRQALIEEHGLDEDDEALLTTLDGETDIMDQLASMMRKAREMETWIEANKIAAKAIAERNRSLEAKIERLERIVIYYLDFVGRKRLEAPDFAYALAKGRPALVGSSDPYKLPMHLMRMKVEEDRAAIFKALQAGETVEGYSISNGPPHLRNVP